MKSTQEKMVEVQFVVSTFNVCAFTVDTSILHPKPLQAEMDSSVLYVSMVLFRSIVIFSNVILTNWDCWILLS